MYVLFSCMVSWFSDNTYCAGSSGPVHNVILIECIFRSGNPGGSGFWVKGNRWGTGGNKGGQFTSNREKRWTDPDTARRVPSK
jgi:hypothetical protein